MKCSFSTDRFVVYDDVLTEQKFKELVRYVSDQAFRSVHEDGWQKVWSLADGAVLKGRHSVYSNAKSATSPETGEPVLERKKPAAEPAFALYPTGDSIDDLLALIIGLQPQVSSLIGRQTNDWERFSAIAYIYPAGTGLSWHNDEGTYTGAFTFYISENWQSNWGGELMLYLGSSTELKSKIIPPSELPQYIDDAIPFSRTAVGDGVGIYVEPRPNRLVILKGGTPHKISHVISAAGARARATIAGFFVKPESKSLPPLSEFEIATKVRKRNVPYVARLHNGKSSLIARGHTYAIGTEDLHEIFCFISETQEPFAAIDLPGNLPSEEKLDLIKSMVGIGMFV